MLVPRRTPSSTSNLTWVSRRFPSPSRSTRVNSMGATPACRRPLSMAAAARSWERTAKASWASRLTLNSLATASAVSPMPQYQSGFSWATRAFGTMRQPPIGMHDMLSVPPAITSSCMPVRILAVAMAMVSSPLEQYRFTVMPGTFSVSSPMSEIRRPTFRPCSASGEALPTITSWMRLGSNSGREATRWRTTCAARSSGRTSRRVPLVALPTALRDPAMM